MKWGWFFVEVPPLPRSEQIMRLLKGQCFFALTVQHPEHVKHLVLVGPAGFNAGSDRLMQFRSTWKGVLANYIWESNFTPQKIVRYVV